MTRPTRTCIDCGTLTTATRCRPCAARREREHRGSRAERGYDRRHIARARAQIAAQPVCRDCGTTADLTAGHIRHGDPSSPLVTQCRSCNSREACLRKLAAVS